jgi:hypothetical protein
MLTRLCCLLLVLTLAGCQERYLDPNAGATPISPEGQPTPAIVSLSPTSGRVGTSVVIAGINFGNAQGSASVTFNGAPATATAWATNSLTVTVPGGATTGNVIVNAGGLPSNSMSFTVTQ